MKKLLVGLAFMSVHVVGFAVTLTPLDYVSVLVNGVRFFVSNSTPKEIIVTAEGEGATKDEAIKSALVNAVQKGIGVLVVSDVTAQDDKIVRNLAATYSSGVVNSYEVKGCEKNVCTVTAKVSPWKFQRRLEGHGTFMKVNGSDLHGQYITMQQALIQRHKLLNYYFSQIHQSGLDAKIRKVQITPSADSQVELFVEYEVVWNSEFKENMIKFLQKMEEDTNGKTEVSHQLYIQWGPTGFFENRVRINTYDLDVYRSLHSMMHRSISVGIPELGFCKQYEVSGDVFKIDWYGFRKTALIKVNPNQLKNIDKLNINVGCKVK